MRKVSTAVLIGLSAAFFSGGAWAQGAFATQKSAGGAFSAPANEQTGMRLNSGTDEHQHFITEAAKPRPVSGGYSTAAADPTPDSGLNSGFPKGPVSSGSLADIPGAGQALSGGSFGRSASAPAEAPAAPRGLSQSATLALGHDTATVDGLSAGMSSNNVTLGR